LRSIIFLNNYLSKPYRNLTTDKNYITLEAHDRQRHVENEQFRRPPCDDLNVFYKSMNIKPDGKIEVLGKRFFQFICPNEANLPKVVNHWPMYRDNAGTLRFFPRKVIEEHLESNNCKKEPYQEALSSDPWTFTATTYTQSFDPEFPDPPVIESNVSVPVILGCHGLPLYRAASGTEHSNTNLF